VSTHEKAAASSEGLPPRLRKRWAMPVEEEAPVLGGPELQQPVPFVEVGTAGAKVEVGRVFLEPFKQYPYGAVRQRRGRPRGEVLHEERAAAEGE
jgi:hypothetical protein